MDQAPFLIIGIIVETQKLVGVATLKRITAIKNDITKMYRYLCNEWNKYVKNNHAVDRDAFWL